MTPTGLSQVSEQILRVGTAVGFSLFLLQAGYSQEVAVAGASFGAVAGSIGAIGIMLYYLKRTKTSRLQEISGQPHKEVLKNRKIYRQLLKTSIPISLASTAIPVLYFIDSSTVIALLQGDLGYREAKEMLGILTGRAQSLASIPPILAIAMSSAILPVVASAYSKKDLKEVQRMGAVALRLTLLTGAPLALYFTSAAFAVNGLLFGNTEGSWVISALCFGSIFQILMMSSMAILQGLGKTTLSMWHVFMGIFVKALLNILFAPMLGIYGIILSTSCGFIVILVLNMKSIRQVVRIEILGKRLKGFLVASFWYLYLGLTTGEIGKKGIYCVLKFRFPVV